MRFRTLGILLLALACFPVLATVTPLPGAAPQRAFAMVPFANEIAVRVTDEGGAPVAGATVSYSDSLGGTRAVDPDAGQCWVDFMIVYTCEKVTGIDGVARFPRMRGQFAGTFTPTLVAYLGPRNLGLARLELAVDPLQVPATLAITSGNDQAAVIGTPLAPITVRLLGNDGRPRGNAILWYEPMTLGPGGFALPSAGNADARTDAAGMATLPTLTASWGVGAHEARVRYFDPDALAYVEGDIRYVATNAQGGTTLDLAGLWWNGPSESGWGMSVFQHDDRLFNVWFVYDSTGRPTWFVQSSGTWTHGLGSQFDGRLYRPHGAPYYNYEAARFEVGTGTGFASTTFAGPEAGATLFSADEGAFGASLGAGWGKRLVRQPFGQGEAAPIRGVGDLWWGGPSQDGWGLAIHEQAGTLFMAWFTYGDDGLPTWFVMPGGQWAADGRYAGKVYRTTGPYWAEKTFDTNAVKATEVGRYELRFSSPLQARLDATVQGNVVGLDLFRQPF